MDRALQTKELKLHLLHITEQFVQKYLRRYYKQYRGDIHDLVMDYYLDFLTPKSRVKGEEETLLDKYDESITSLEYLVKIAVQRKLIDSSRSNPVVPISIDSVSDEFGDAMATAFGLVDTQDKESSLTIGDLACIPASEILYITAKFKALSASAKLRVQKQFAEMKCALSPAFQELFSGLCPPEPEETPEPIKVQTIQVETSEGPVNGIVQQVTSKTVVVIVRGVSLEFSVETGLQRKKDPQEYLSESVLSVVQAIKGYHSGFTRAALISLNS